VERYHFDPKMGTCQKFFFGGCDGTSCFIWTGLSMLNSAYTNGLLIVGSRVKQAWESSMWKSDTRFSKCCGVDPEPDRIRMDFGRSGSGSRWAKITRKNGKK
jgi:hypothetical protein